MAMLGLEHEHDYYERLQGDLARMAEAELRQLLNLVTVTETCFFRDAGQYRLLRERVIPELIRDRSVSGQPRAILRIWSAGCSTGDEAYSVAMTLDDMGVFRKHPELTVEIIGTDVNSEALEKARQAVYPGRAVRNVDGRLLDRYFRRDGTTFRLNDEIRHRVRFEFGNLMQTPLPSTGSQDVVICKNVAIYFRSDVTRKLVHGLHDTIAPGGYLLLGHSESLWQMSDGFELIEHERAFCYRKVLRRPSVRRAGLVPQDPPAMVAQDFSPVGTVAQDFSPAGTVAQDFSPVGAVAQDFSPAGTVAQDFSPAGTVAQDFSPAGTVAQDFSPVGAVAQDFSPVATRYDACLALFRNSEWDAAETALIALVKSCPTFVPGYLLLGGVYAHRARYDEAVKQAESALRLTDLEPRAHLLLGMIASRCGRSDAARTSLERALYLDDSLALAHFWLGNLCRDAGDVARACDEYQNVVDGWERHTLRWTEEFALDLTVEQIVEFCRASVRRLNGISPTYP